MNWNLVEGRWKRYSGNIKESWGKLTHNDSVVFRGKREQLLGTIQERYGVADQYAEMQVDEFARSLYAELCEPGSNSNSDREHTRRAGTS
jgi:uncharacterized protein YjbJ (UPF0337 family)